MLKAGGYRFFATSVQEANVHMPIRAVIFDLDGTITQPYLDFDAIRREIGLGEDGGPVLEAMEKMPPQQRRRTEEILHYHEEKALAASQLNEGAEETLACLRDRDIHVGVLTRNRKCNALAIAEKHGLHFDAVLGREDGPVKPDAFGVRHLCRHFGVEPAEARAAGAVGVLIVNHGKAGTFAEHADFTIEKLSEILRIIDEKNDAERAAS